MEPHHAQEYLMKTNKVVIILGVYIFAMGIIAFIRTSSFTPLFFNGCIAAVTVWLGWLNGQGMRSVQSATQWWLTIIALLLGYLTFGPISAHPNPNIGSALIFGSMALFALLALILVIRSKPSFSGRRRLNRL